MESIISDCSKRQKGNFIKSTIILTLMFLNAAVIYSQDNDLKPHFISLTSGIFISSNNEFSRTYYSKYGFIYGLEIGLANTSRSYFFIKVSRFSKTGSQIYREFDLTTDPPVLISEKKGDLAEYSQWIVNEGFIYNFFMNPEWTFGFNGGVTFSLVSEEGMDMRGTEPHGTIGFFAGAVIEKKFSQSLFSIFIEPQYNYIKSDELTGNGYHGNYGGMSLNAGVRCYLANRN